MDQAVCRRIDEIRPSDCLENVMEALRSMRCSPRKVAKPVGDHLNDYEIHFSTMEGDGVFGITDWAGKKRKGQELHGYVKCQMSIVDALVETITMAICTGRYRGDVTRAP